MPELDFLQDAFLFMIQTDQNQQLKSPLHFRRIEVKYLLPNKLIPEFDRHIRSFVRADPFLEAEKQAYPVTSLYFDSPDLKSFFEKEAGVLQRWKLRLRTYSSHFSPDDTLFLEVKRRSNFIILKDRCRVDGSLLNRPFADPLWSRHLLNACEDESAKDDARHLFAWYNLQPTALVQYRRVPYIALEDDRFRITIDRDLRGVWRPHSLLGQQSYWNCMDGWNVVEVKCNTNIPRWFQNVIQSMNLQRVSHSKYALVGEKLRLPRLL